MTKLSKTENFDKELKKLEKMLKVKNSHDDEDDDEMEGGKMEGPLRHFRIVILDNKEIHRSESGIGAAEAKITMKANPVDAAKKLLSSICKHQGLKKMNRLKCHSVYWIKETTRGSKGKVYGPYKGTFVKIDEKEVKLDTGKVIKYFVKPDVKKHREVIHESVQKKVDNIMKGGKSTM